MQEPFTMQLAGVRGIEWIILCAILLVLFFGVKKIPELARSFGRASGEFEKAKIEMRRELHALNNSGDIDNFIISVNF